MRKLMKCRACIDRWVFEWRLNYWNFIGLSSFSPPTPRNRNSPIYSAYKLFTVGNDRWLVRDGHVVFTCPFLYTLRLSVTSRLFCYLTWSLTHFWPRIQSTLLTYVCLILKVLCFCRYCYSEIYKNKLVKRIVSSDIT